MSGAARKASVKLNHLPSAHVWGKSVSRPCGTTRAWADLGQSPCPPSLPTKKAWVGIGAMLQQSPHPLRTPLPHPSSKSFGAKIRDFLGRSHPLQLGWGWGRGGSGAAAGTGFLASAG